MISPKNNLINYAEVNEKKLNINVGNVKMEQAPRVVSIV
jgi:hypothetical protein